MVKGIKTEEGLLVKLAGKVDTTNSAETEAEIKALRNQNPEGKFTLDAEELTYISSSGLRIMLSLRKSEPSFTIINVTPEVYTIFETTGFTEIIPIEKMLHRLTVDGCQVLGWGAKGTVYRYSPELIVKVYNDRDSLPAIKRERMLAKMAFVAGMPTAISFDVVKVGDKYGSVFELLNAKSFTQMIKENPEEIKDYAIQFADLLKEVHAIEALQPEISDIKDLISTWVCQSEHYLGEKLTAMLNDFIEKVPDTKTMIHGDYHTNNVMMQNGEALLIDMDTLSQGHPVFELANIYITYVAFGEIDPSIVEKFLDLPYDMAKEFWNLFFDEYMKGESEENKKAMGDMAKMLSYLRYMRHTARRAKNHDEESMKIIAYCKEKIEELGQGAIDAFLAM